MKHAELWEILIPRYTNSGKEFPLAHHRVWDSHVREISGGMTILKTAKGQWRPSGSSEFQVEEMIPVRILCSRAQIDQIIDYTLAHYDQEAILAYRISDTVILRHRTGTSKRVKTPKTVRKTTRARAARQGR